MQPSYLNLLKMIIATPFSREPNPKSLILPQHNQQQSQKRAKATLDICYESEKHLWNNIFKILLLK